MEEYLHKTLMDMATPDMTFEELYYFMNDLIVKKGFLNLDFLGNFGHSIVKNKNDRIYTEKGNHKKYQMLKCSPLNRTSVSLIPNMGTRERISIILIMAGS